jgi:hypothetical protein
LSPDISPNQRPNSSDRRRYSSSSISPRANRSARILRADAAGSSTVLGEVEVARITAHTIRPTTATMNSHPIVIMLHPKPSMCPNPPASARSGCSKRVLIDVPFSCYVHRASVWGRLSVAVENGNTTSTEPESRMSQRHQRGVLVEIMACAHHAALSMGMGQPAMMTVPFIPAA